MLKMAASCCPPPAAIFPLPRSPARFRMVSSSSAIQSQLGHRVGLSFRVPRSLETRRSVRVYCIGDYNKTPVVTGTSWDKLILNSDIPVLVEFYASWCGPCRMVHRVIDEIATDYLGRLKCFVLNADHDPRIAEGYDIKAVPVVLLFKNGKKHDSVIGTMPKEFYVAAIERVLSS